jgi:oxygen-independent coproporphyrinogen-3 oxidase
MKSESNRSNRRAAGQYHSDPYYTKAIEHLYVHIPYCHRICPYCSFYKHLPGQADQSDLVSAILAEAADAAAHHHFKLRTLYLGGGTPSLLKTQELHRLFQGLDEILDNSAVEERSLEANPRTFDLTKACAMRDCGVHRVSLGIQSWCTTTLQTLGRDHTPEQAEAAYSLLRKAGIPGINIDLMFSIPGQPASSWRETLTRTLALAPDHISTYNLTYEEDTAFFERLQAGEMAHDEETDADHFSMAMELLGAAGYEHYEISNHALPGHRSLHNQAYWRGHDYLGIGPGAVSTVNGTRYTNLKDTAAYTKCWRTGNPPPRECETINDTARNLERIALGLRHADGVASATLPAAALSELVEGGFITTEKGQSRLTHRGKMLADPVIAHLVEQVT